MPDNRIWPSGQNPQGMVAGGSSQGLEMAPMQQMQQMQQLGQHDRGGLSRFYSKQDAMVPEIELNSHHGGYVYFNSHFPESHDLMGDHMRPTSTIGKYNPEERENLLNRFRKKRAERCYNRKVKYVSRKLLADNRPRVKGRFAKATGIGDGEEGGEGDSGLAVIGRKRKADDDDDGEEEDDEEKPERLESAAHAVFNAETVGTAQGMDTNTGDDARVDNASGVEEGPVSVEHESLSAVDPEADANNDDSAERVQNVREVDNQQPDDLADSHITEVTAGGHDDSGSADDEPAADDEPSGEAVDESKAPVDEQAEAPDPSVIEDEEVEDDGDDDEAKADDAPEDAPDVASGPEDE